MKLKNKLLIVLLLFIFIFLLGDIKSYAFSFEYNFYKRGKSEVIVPDDLILETLTKNELNLDLSSSDILMVLSDFSSVAFQDYTNYDIDIYVGDVDTYSNGSVNIKVPCYRFNYRFSDLNRLSSSYTPYCESCSKSSYTFNGYPVIYVQGNTVTYSSCDIYSSDDVDDLYFPKSDLVLNSFPLFRKAGNTSSGGSGEGGNSGSTGSETNTTGSGTGSENTNTSGTDNTGSDNNNSFGKDDDSKNWLVNILENVFVGFFEGIINPIKQIFEFLGKVLTGIPNFFATILDYLNPFSENFILSDIIDFLGRILSYINPFSENFFGIKLIELLKNLLQTLFIPEERMV